MADTILIDFYIHRICSGVVIYKSYLAASYVTVQKKFVNIYAEL